MSRLKIISGKECIKILCDEFGFNKIKQKGSHLVLRKETFVGTIGTVVPDHKNLKIGTLKGILDLANVDEEDFIKYL